MFAKVAVAVPLFPHATLLDYRIPNELAADVKVGSLVEVPFRNQKNFGIVFETSNIATYDTKKIKSIASVKIKEPIFDATFLEFLRWLSKRYLYPIGEVVETAIPSSIRESSVKVLEKGLLALEKPAAPKKAKKAADVNDEKAIQLNSDQLGAINNVLSKKEGTTLVWGVTGSGKTEVYLKIIEEKLKAGFGAIVLVPEISLTPQLTQRFEKRFPGLISVFHSDQKSTDTRKAWLKSYLGQSRIAIGPRSALFAPIRNLGVVIIDEEHDSSYKQEERLKYHAREAAAALCQLRKIPLVLGSATPSVESYVLAQDNGPEALSVLTKRAHGQSVMPEITIVDLKKSLPQENKNPMDLLMGEPSMTDLTPAFRGDFFFTPELRAGIEECLSSKKQAILFLNRRGIGSQAFCPKCGDTPECPSCDVKLTPHKGYMSCHYCGYQIKSMLPCKTCKQNEFEFVEAGLGTEAVEQGAKLFFPQARILRLDRDTTATAGSLHQILDDFRDKKADILIGTQMVAKGHDFPDVTFVGVMLADLGWSVPDFRATERSLQLLLQVSGRAGRSVHPGKVVLQTFQPEAPVLRFLKMDTGLEGYRKFLDEDLFSRKELWYAPYGKCALIRFDGLDSNKVQQAAQVVKAALSRLPKDKVRVLGPTPSPLSKIKLRYRYQIFLKTIDSDNLHKSLSWIDESWNQKKLETTYKTRMVIDVDPISML